MKKMVFLNAVILSILLLAVLIIGCAGPTPAPTPSLAPAPVPTPEPAIPEHYTTYSEEGLFSISYPSNWEPALSLMEELEQTTKDLLKGEYPELPLGQASLIFLAGEPIEGGYIPNVTITVESLSEIMTHDEVVEYEIRGLKYVCPDYHEFSRVKTTISGREAAIFDCELTYPEIGKGHQLFMVMSEGKVAWIVCCTPPSGEYRKYENDFHSIVRSLRILK